MCEAPKNFITSDMVNHIRYDKSMREAKYSQHSKSWGHPRFMFVFENADIASAAYHLAERMHKPFCLIPIAGVAVHESVRDRFIEQVRNRFRQLKPDVATHPNFERSLAELKAGGIKYVVAPEENAPPFASPILVTDNISQLFFSMAPSGVVIVRTFRTIKEAQGAFHKETPHFQIVYVFDEGVTSVYELAKGIPSLQFFVNCCDVNLKPIVPYGMNTEARAILENGYHFESLELGGAWKIIAFPFASMMVPQCKCPPHFCTCHVLNNAC